MNERRPRCAVRRGLRLCHDRGVPQVTISIPYYRSPATIRRAVMAVLNQTYDDLICVVTCDGDRKTPPWRHLADITDSRLIRHTLTENHGRYYADAVVLAATRSEWFTVHDADDAARPDWLRSQLDLAQKSNAQAVFCAHTISDPSGSRTVLDTPKRFNGSLQHYAHMAGLWRTDFLRQLGGPRPDFRVGYDTMLTGAAMATGKVAVHPDVLYDRYLQISSLTRSPSSRVGSPLREQSRRWITRMWPAATRAAKISPERAGNILKASIPHAMKEGINARAHNLEISMAKSLIQNSLPAWATCLEDEEMWGSWALNVETARTLAAYLECVQPTSVVESGSGSSTVLFSQYAEAHKANILALEGSPVFQKKTKELLEKWNTGKTTRVIHAPLTREKEGPWYQGDLPEHIDLALVDGPRQADGGRGAAMRHLMPRMSPGATIILDDTDRSEEKRTMSNWKRLYGLDFTSVQGSSGTASLAIIPPVQSLDTGGSHLALTILTGHRPGHLANTLDRIDMCAPGILERAHVTLLHNGSDRETEEVISRYEKVIDHLWSSQNLASIGEATSMLAQQARMSGRRYWLHLEDDWCMIPTTPDWLGQAQRVLESRSAVYQVRLRHMGEFALNKHMVTGRPLSWVAYKGYQMCRDAHYTCNPSLIRCSDIHKIWPARGEREAQRNAHRASLRGVARLTPGVFVHTGDGKSLRGVTGCAT